MTTVESEELRVKSRKKSEARSLPEPCALNSSLFTLNSSLLLLTFQHA